MNFKIVKSNMLIKEVGGATDYRNMKCYVCCWIILFPLVNLKIQYYQTSRVSVFQNISK